MIEFARFFNDLIQIQFEMFKTEVFSCILTIAIIG